MDLGLSGRTAIVLGATSGMGLAIAEALAGEGANVTMLGRRRELLEREAARLGALAVRGDLTNPRALESVVDKTVAAFGGIDILVLNGGGPPAGRALELTPEAIEAAFELLLVPHIRLVRLALPHLRASDAGRVIAIESTSVTEPLPNLALSNAVRPGVAGWLKTLADELGPEGITVNTVAPGLIDTDRGRAMHPEGVPAGRLAAIPLRRTGEAQEVAAVVAFLASRPASYLTGTVIRVDGGSGRAIA
ncbi:MAG: SDR family oxidoreductase [Gaiella sp.]